MYNKHTYVLHTRCVCWSAFLLKKHPKLGKLGVGGASRTSCPVSASATSDYETKVPLDQRVYSQYFVQDSDTDAGFLMDTKVPVSEVSASIPSYLQTNLEVYVQYVPLCTY